MAKFVKNIKKVNSSEAIWRIKRKLCRNVNCISLYNNGLLLLLMFFHCYGNMKFPLTYCEKWKLASVAISLQIFWQKFYRKVPWLVLYQTYHFCPNLWIKMIGCQGNRKDLFTKNIKNQLIRILKGLIWNFADLFITFSEPVQNCAFYCHCSCTFIALATESFHWLVMGKVKIGIYCYLISDILTKLLQKWSLSNPCTKHIILAQTSLFDW